MPFDQIENLTISIPKWNVVETISPSERREAKSLLDASQHLCGRWPGDVDLHRGPIPRGPLSQQQPMPEPQMIDEARCG